MFKRENQGRRVLDDVEQFSTLLGPETTLTGQINGQDDCIISGRIIGDGKFEGVLVIDESGAWEGNITAKNLIISGEVNGDIVVNNKCELTSTARVAGSITSPGIAIAEGAIHQGEIRMAQQSVIHFKEKRQSTPNK